MKRTIVTLLMTSVIATLACNTYNVVKPLYPKVGGGSVPVVDTLQPTFKWEYLGTDTHTSQYNRYDHVVHEVIVNKENTPQKVVGDRVYYRESIMGTEHQMEEPLKPGSEYCWSVRQRQGDVVGSWARYNQTAFIGVAVIGKNNALFRFKTSEDAGP